MSYSLGLDIGTTNSTAAIADGNQIRVLSIGHEGAVVPTVVHINADGERSVGRLAQRRAESDPAGVAREFKRRFGDTTPLLLQQTPVLANELMIDVARWLIAAATEQMGGPPERLAVTHPANWGAFKTGLFSDSLADAGLPPHVLVSEPEAAAIHYASQQRVSDGTTIAVYDLGGGTFDAAIMTKSAEGWTLRGKPTGLERLGGIDFDTALFHHVVSLAGVDLDALDPEDGQVLAAVSRLREDCLDAKHALSDDTTATVTTLFPQGSQQIRVTRAEFERMIAPIISRTLELLDTAVAGAGLGYADIDRILMVGGSSRIPLVAARVASHTGRPLGLDAHPKHVVALGAATLAGAEQMGPPAANPTEAPAAAPPVNPAPAPPIDPSTPPTTVIAEVPAPTPSPNPDADLVLPPKLATMFGDVPHISEGLPEFMDPARRMGATAPASAPANQPPSATPPPPNAPSSPAPPTRPVSAAPPRHADNPTEALRQSAAPPAPQPRSPAGPSRPVPSAPQSQPPTATRAPQRRKAPLRLIVLGFLGLAVAVAAVVVALNYQQDRDRTEAGPADTTDTTVANTDPQDPGTTEDSTPPPTGSDTTVPVGSTPEEPPAPPSYATPDIDTCPAGTAPDPTQRYQIQEIPADDPDGGANIRSGPGTNNEVRRVFPSFTPIEPTGRHCAADHNGRPWWGIDVNGEVEWVAASLVIPA